MHSDNDVENESQLKNHILPNWIVLSFSTRWSVNAETSTEIHVELENNLDDVWWKQTEDSVIFEMNEEKWTPNRRLV